MSRETYKMILFFIVLLSYIGLPVLFLLIGGFIGIIGSIFWLISLMGFAIIGLLTTLAKLIK